MIVGIHIFSRPSIDVPFSNVVAEASVTVHGQAVTTTPSIDPAYLGAEMVADIGAIINQGSADEQLKAPEMKPDHSNFLEEDRPGVYKDLQIRINSSVYGVAAGAVRRVPYRSGAAIIVAPIDVSI